MTRRIIHIALLLVVSVALTGCVHEWTDGTKVPREVDLTFLHTNEWTEHEYTFSRADDNHLSRYHVMVFREGEKASPLLVKEFTRSDVPHADFTCTLRLKAGVYDVYAWSDYADAGGVSHFYDSGDFSQITYNDMPYEGNSHFREAYRGFTKVTVDAVDDYDYHPAATIDMEVPLSRYEFRATDFDDFIVKETSRVKPRAITGKSDVEALAPSRISNLDQYRVKMIYTGYMPSTFNLFMNRPVNSATGVTYESKITDLGNGEASLGFDHVLVNGTESTVAVAMELYDPDGNLIANSPPVSVPTKRGRHTIVRGKFLTSIATSGVGINPAFNGDYNIEIK